MIRLDRDDHMQTCLILRKSLHLDRSDRRILGWRHQEQTMHEEIHGKLELS